MATNETKPNGRAPLMWEDHPAVRRVIQLAERHNAALPEGIRARFAAGFSPREVPDGARRDPSQVYFSVHIPKTAGMSFGKALAEVAGFHAVPWDDVEGGFVAQEVAARAAAKATQQTQIVMGHFGWVQLLGPVTAGHRPSAIAFLRDPVARLVSNYDYNRSLDHPAFERFRTQYPTFARFVARQPVNPMLSQLIGERPTFEMTLNALSCFYSFLGLAEAYGASLAHLARSHGFKGLSEYQQNTASVRRQRLVTEVSPKKAAQIYRAHFEDLRVFLLLRSFFAPGE